MANIRGDDDSSLPARAPAPLYQQAADWVEHLIMSAPLDDHAPLPPEGVLMARLGVSRGTLRRAIELLAQRGLLHVQAGRGTYVDQDVKVRTLVWQRLVDVARPDSRFDLDLSRFVPDFEGREAADERILTLPAVASASLAFVAPDNSLEAIRAQLLRGRTDLIVPTYNLRRGLIHIAAREVPPGAAELAATLDGMERYGERLSLDQLRGLNPIDVVISGAVAVTTHGVHFGSGAGNLDLEWSLFRHVGLTDESTPVLLSVHEAQVLEADLSPGEHDLVADLIATPTRLIECPHTFQKPDSAYWLAASAHHPLTRALMVHQNEENS